MKFAKEIPMKEKELLLLVDGCRWTREMLRGYLVDKGYRVMLAANAFEAFEKARFQRPDLILMKLAPPKSERSQVLTWFKSHSSFCSIPLVAIGETHLCGERERALHTGADFFVSKPISLRNLSDKIRTWLNYGKTPVSLCARLLGA
jgi:CheY-like chemotaxis protein